MTIPISPIPNNPIAENHEWRDWFFKLYTYTTTAGSQAFNGLNFLGSNITSIVTRNHNDLTLIQGGDSLNRYHLTSAEHASVASLPTFGTMATQNTTSYSTTGTDTTYSYRANNLSDLGSASTARTNLGLGTLATQSASAVAITGGTATVTIGLTNTTSTTVGVAGIATVPPLPVGYIAITIGGTAYKMPYYNV